MAEVKITCPNCFSEDRCFESKMEIEDFSSYMCFKCGFTSNSLYKNDTETLEKAKEIVNSGDFSGDEIIERDHFQITESYEESEE